MGAVPLSGIPNVSVVATLVTRTTRRAPVAVALALLPAALSGQAPTVETLSWMAGCWLAGEGENVSEEVWLPARGGAMIGMARAVRGGSLSGYELLSIRRVGDGLVFTAHPSGQRETDFEVTHAETGLLRVENAAHDFPQKLEYRGHRPDSLVAGVFGGVDDASPAFAVRYGRVECPDVPAEVSGS